jgi:hypothetical protein
MKLSQRWWVEKHHQCIFYCNFTVLQPPQVSRVNELALGYPEGRIELQLIGGFRDQQGYAEDLFNNIMREFSLFINFYRFFGCEKVSCFITSQKIESRWSLLCLGVFLSFVPTSTTASMKSITYLRITMYLDTNDVRYYIHKVHIIAIIIDDSTQRSKSFFIAVLSLTIFPTSFRVLI